MVQNKANQTVLKSRSVWTVSFVMVHQPVMGQVLTIIEASRLHSDTPPSVGLLWTNDGLVAGTCTWRHAALTIDRHLYSRQDSNLNPSKRALAQPCLRPRGQQVRRFLEYLVYQFNSITITCIERKWTVLINFSGFIWCFANSRTVKMQVMPVRVAAKAAPPAGMWLRELWTSNVLHYKRVSSFVVQRYKNTFITSVCYCFASCMITSR
jgi:hypothetical protein